MSGKIPAEVSKVIEKLDASDQEILNNYLAQLNVSEEHNDSDNEDVTTDKESPKKSSKDSDDSTDEEPPFPPIYDSTTTTNDDPDALQKHLDEAATLKSTGDYAGALDAYTAAVLCSDDTPASVYSHRADCLIRLERPRAAARDGDLALAKNPDSAKALRLRGRAKKMLGDWRGARRDLSASQSIDFDDGAADDLRFVMEKVRDVENVEVKERLEEEERKRRLLEQQRQARQQREAAQEDEDDDAATPSGAGARSTPMPPPGMEGLMSSLLSDPELAAGMRDPKIMGALQEVMSGPGGPMGLLSNPQKLQQLMTDPTVGPFFQKLIGKMGMGGMGGMAGMAGMGGMGGAPPASQRQADDLDEIPDLDMD